MREDLLSYGTRPGQVPLQAIFPEEMKGIHRGINAIGRTINTLNPLFAASLSAK
jgi:hypothetical protein